MRATVPPEVEKRFWEKVQKTKGGCWEWMASTDSSGYGTFKVKEKTVSPHRLSYRMHIDEIPEGKLVCHKCDNPRCVNPDHLWLGTNWDNAMDKKKKRRDYMRHGVRNPCARLEEESVIEIATSYDPLAGRTQKYFAEKFGVDKSTVAMVLRGRKWSSLTGFKNTTGIPGGIQQMSSPTTPTEV